MTEGWQTLEKAGLSQMDLPNTVFVCNLQLQNFNYEQSCKIKNIPATGRHRR